MHTIVLYQPIHLFLRHLIILPTSGFFTFHYSLYSSMFRNIFTLLFLFSLSHYSSPLLSSSPSSLHLLHLLNFLFLFLFLQSYFKPGTRTELLVTGTDGVQRTMHLSLAANPSHLEAVYPVVIGKAKAKQFFINDFER